MPADLAPAVSTADIRNLGLRLCLPGPIRVGSARTVADAIVRPAITSNELARAFTELTGLASEEFPLSLRIFEYDPQPNDHVMVRAVENDLPLIVRRDEEAIVNFDIRATRAFRFVDSKRPIYTYVPGFNIQWVPAAMRRPLSNFVQSIRSPRNTDVVGKYRRLPLTSFEFVMLLLNTVLTSGREGETRQLFQWPSGKRAVFVSLHDVDTGGFLRRREDDPLFRLEQKHEIHSTWFIPTAILKGKEAAIDFLLRSGNEVGWHGYNHDHRLPFRPFTERRVEILKQSYFTQPENFPTGMRTPKLLKSNHLFDVLDRSCQALSYDTSFVQGIVPYYLWVNGRESRILEIPTTVPTEIRVYNELQHVPRSRRPEAILEAQIARTNRLVGVGGMISIVTHPEKDLSERPDFLEIYDQYLSYIKSRPDIWFATAGELFRYWTGESSTLGGATRCAH